MDNNRRGTKDFWGEQISPFLSCSKVFSGACTGENPEPKASDPPKDNSSPRLARDIATLTKINADINDPRNASYKMHNLRNMLDVLSDYEARGRLSQLPSEFQDTKKFKAAYRTEANDFLDRSIIPLNTTSSTPAGIRDRSHAYGTTYFTVMDLQERGIQDINTSMSRLGTYQDAFVAQASATTIAYRGNLMSDISNYRRTGTTDPLLGASFGLELMTNTYFLSLLHPERAPEIGLEMLNAMGSLGNMAPVPPLPTPATRP